MREGTTILDINVHCLQSTIDVSQQLTKPLSVFFYIGHAVSVQNSSGAILGCGRFESHFPVYASYHGQIALQQITQYHLTSLAAVTVPLFKIFLNIVLESVGDSCPSKAAIFDPWKPPPEQVGHSRSPDRFPIGILSSRLVGTNGYIDVPLIGSATILGHAVCIHHDTKSMVTSGVHNSLILLLCILIAVDKKML